MFLNSIFEPLRQTSGKPPAKVRKASQQTFGNDAIVIALRKRPAPVSISELAGLMGCSVGEASKRVKAARKFLTVRKCGRRKLVSLKAPTFSDVDKLMATLSCSDIYWTARSQ